MTDFATWDRETLNRFAREAAQEILALREERSVAIKAYRELLLKYDRMEERTQK